MARTTPDEVMAIMDTQLEIQEVDPYCDSAHVFIEAALVTPDDAGLSEDLLKEIEKWTAAHMISMSKERQAKDQGAGGAYIKYTGYWAKGMEQTSYGQMAINLDTSGTLQDIAKGFGKASIYAVPEFN